MLGSLCTCRYSDQHGIEHLHTYLYLSYIHISTYRYFFSCLMAVSSFIIDHCSLVKTDYSTMLKSSLSTAGQSL